MRVKETPIWIGRILLVLAGTVGGGALFFALPAMGRANTSPLLLPCALAVLGGIVKSGTA